MSLLDDLRDWQERGEDLNEFLEAHFPSEKELQDPLSRIALSITQSLVLHFNDAIRTNDDNHLPVGPARYERTPPNVEALCEKNSDNEALWHQITAPPDWAETGLRTIRKADELLQVDRETRLRHYDACAAVALHRVERFWQDRKDGASLERLAEVLEAVFGFYKASAAGGDYWHRIGEESVSTHAQWMQTAETKSGSGSHAAEAKHAPMKIAKRYAFGLARKYQHDYESAQAAVRDRIGDAVRKVYRNAIAEENDRRKEVGKKLLKEPGPHTPTDDTISGWITQSGQPFAKTPQ